MARDLLTESGSVFVQIGDENVHRVRALMDEVFGEENFIRKFLLRQPAPTLLQHLSNTVDFLLMVRKIEGFIAQVPSGSYGLKLIGSDKSGLYKRC